jgi:hypothetical protein
MSNLLWVNERLLYNNKLMEFVDFNKVADGYFSFIPRFSLEPNKWGIPNENNLLSQITEDCNFVDATNTRLSQILKLSDDTNLPILIHWSGGIDSTLILSSFLKHCDSNTLSNVHILMGETSIIEHPEFYKKYIDGKFNIIKGSDYNVATMVSQYINITGQPADQLFYYPRSLEFFSTDSNIKDEVIKNAKKTAGLTLTTSMQVSWWAHFNYNWNDARYLDLIEQATSATEEAVLNYKNNHIKWFDCIEYQSWAFNRDQSRDINPILTKMDFKNYIYDFDKDADYRDNKVKKGSMKKPPVVPTILALTSQGKAIIDVEEFYSSLPSA